jgi:hypothetical protein
MIKFTISQDSTIPSEGPRKRFNVPGETRLDPDPADLSHHVPEDEVSALWNVIKGGMFERQAKSKLEKFCAARGYNAGKLLS